MKKKPALQSLCPLCSKLSDQIFFPFCSRTCEYIDLGLWLRGEYVIPGAPVDEELSSGFESDSEDI